MSTNAKALKRKRLRNTEYYSLQDVYDKLYAKSKSGSNFTNLLEIICRRENIRLAYRNIKNNKGSNTPGTDKKTIKNMANLTEEELVKYVRRRLANYIPQPVRRKEIPKPNGGNRPLGIPTIADRLIQQCILQVLEPICEAKFHERSNGFRPNRSCENALAQAYKYIQQMNLHFVVDIDIKGFFDNVSHAKLLKQMWSMGIHDKSLISIIGKMLKAEVAEIGFPEKGTPQGGIISPLLSNIVLNELDWWITSQWEEIITRHKYGGKPLYNGTITKGGKYNALRRTSNLKECYIVRYADDFKIFCKTRSDARRIFIATEQWLKERLGLSISPDKSHIVNLKKNYSEFLGFKLKMRPKGKKYVVTSHIGDKTLNHIQTYGKNLVKELQRPSGNVDILKSINQYNAWVLGVQNYYRFATNVQEDLDPIAFRLRKNLEIRLKAQLSKHSNVPLSKYLNDRFGKTKQMRYLYNHPILPLGYVQHKSPMYKKKLINNYTSQGRELIHNELPATLLTSLNTLMKYPILTRSVEYNDNRISLFAGQLGKCAVTGTSLELDACEVHHKIPVFMGGSDIYVNLIFVCTAVHKLLHATKAETIAKYIAQIKPNKLQLEKLNRLRNLMNLAKITV